MGWTAVKNRRLNDRCHTIVSARHLRFSFIVVVAANLAFALRVPAQLIKGDAPELQRIDIKENLGEKIPLDLSFVDENGAPVTLAEYMQNGKPVVLTLAYYECPMLCTFVLNGISKAVTELGWSPGDRYEMLTVSIDPAETAALASAKKSVYLERLGETGAGPSANWSFWTGEQEQIKKLADAVGFQYFYDKKKGEYAHPAVVFVLTGEGVISRYLYGIEYPSKNLRLALLEASEGKIGTIVDRVLLYCYHYDPVGKKYTLFAMNIMRLGSGLAALGLAMFVGLLWLKERHPCA